MDVYSEIMRIEHAIHNVQVDHSLNKISTKTAKQRIRQLTDQLEQLLLQLPDDQRELYMLEKQYGVGV